MKREEFLELLKAGLSDCGAQEEQQHTLAEYAERAVENLNDDQFAQLTAVDAHRLALAMYENGESAADSFFAEKEENIQIGENLLSTDEPVFEPDQFFYEFASIEDEPEFVAPIIDDTVSGTRTFNTADVENDIYLSSRKLNRAEKLRRRKNIDKSAKGTPLFWTLLILTLPITAPIFAVIWTFIGVLYATVSAVIAVFVALVVAVVGIGTAFVLVGLIYGIIKCFSLLPIGLYEVGLAVAIAGVTMLFSVLIYNVAVRFTPKLYSLIARFAGWIWHSLQTLYYFCKKECDRK